MSSIDYSEKIPNNVNLARRPHAAARARAVAAQLPQLVGRHGPRGLAELRRLPAHRGQRRPAGLGAVRLREDAATTAGASSSTRAMPTARSTSATTRARRRGRTCPASTAPTCAASSSRRATPSRHRSSSSATSASPRPSQYDLRNLFQVNVEEGRHLWAMVYLLHKHFGRDGREEAEALLERRSGDENNPRILRRLQREDARLAGVLHVHLLHRPRRQVPALRRWPRAASTRWRARPSSC